VRLAAAEEVNGLLGDLGQPCFHARDGAGLLQAQMAALTGEPRAGYVPGSLVERRNGSVHACHRGRRSVPGIARDVCREPSNRIAEADRVREQYATSAGRQARRARAPTLGPRLAWENLGEMGLAIHPLARHRG